MLDPSHYHIESFFSLGGGGGDGDDHDHDDDDDGGGGGGVTYSFFIRKNCYPKYLRIMPLPKSELQCCGDKGILIRFCQS